MLPRKQTHRRGPTASVTAAALVLAACLARGAGSAPPGGYPGGGGPGAPPQRQGQPVRRSTQAYIIGSKPLKIVAVAALLVLCCATLD